MLKIKEGDIINWIKKKIKQKYCQHEDIIFKKDYIDYIGSRVYEYKCDKCGKKLKYLKRY